MNNGRELAALPRFQKYVSQVLDTISLIDVYERLIHADIHSVEVASAISVLSNSHSVINTNKMTYKFS
jgi:hypothetical protein